MEICLCFGLLKARGYVKQYSGLNVVKVMNFGEFLWLGLTQYIYSLVSLKESKGIH